MIFLNLFGFHNLGLTMFPWNRLHNITYTLKLSTETHQCSYQICVAVASVHKYRQLVSHKYAGNPTIPAENLLVILRILTSNPVYTFQTRSQTEKGVPRPVLARELGSYSHTVDHSWYCDDDPLKQTSIPNATWVLQLGA
jgi:hypothetical protein